MKSSQKIKLTFLVFLTFLLIACGQLTNSKNLTVTNIHNKVILGKTTSSDLQSLFGKPNRYITDSKKSQELEEYWNNYEGGVNYSLEDNTNYWETLRYSDDSKTYSYTEIDAYYEYKGQNLGVKSVYFFMVDNKVISFTFNGNITNKSVAKKDKYLRQIID